MALSGHDLLRCTCLLLTQSGHERRGLHRSKLLISAKPPGHLGAMDRMLTGRRWPIINGIGREKPNDRRQFRIINPCRIAADHHVRQHARLLRMLAVEYRKTWYSAEKEIARMDALIGPSRLSGRWPKSADTEEAPTMPNPIADALREKIAEFRSGTPPSDDALRDLDEIADARTVRARSVSQHER